MINNIDLTTLSIEEFQKLASEGKLSSEQLVKCYIKRIRAIDNDLKAVLQISDEAIKIAKIMDEKRSKQRKILGPLHGVPILIEDTISTVNGL